MKHRMQVGVNRHPFVAGQGSEMNTEHCSGNHLELPHGTSCGKMKILNFLPSRKIKSKNRESIKWKIPFKSKNRNDKEASIDQGERQSSYEKSHEQQD